MIATVETNVRTISPKGNTLETAMATNAKIDAFLKEIDVKNDTPKNYRRALKYFFGWAASTGRVVEDLTNADVISYKRHLEDEGKRPNTINTYLIPVRRYYKHIGKASVVRELKNERTTETFDKLPFTESQSAAIWQSTGNGYDYTTAKGKTKHTSDKTNRRDRAVIALMLLCGLRTVEVVRANVGDVFANGDNYVLHVHGKGGHDRNVPLTSNTWVALNDYLMNDRKGAKDSEPLFTSNDHRPENNGGRLATATISRLAKKHIREIGVNDSKHTAHSLRHTCATNIFNNSQRQQHPEKVATQTQMFLGHCSFNTTERYIKQSLLNEYLNDRPNSVCDDIVNGTK